MAHTHANVKYVMYENWRNDKDGSSLNTVHGEERNGGGVYNLEL